MTQDKKEQTQNASILGLSGLSGKTITGASAYVHGSTVVIELAYSGGSKCIKVRGLNVEVGGTSEWGSGTVQI